MYLRHVTPDRERLWADEVFHLHSLWRLGPPGNSNRNPKATSSLRATPSASFKKKRKPKMKKKAQPSASSAAEEVEWPVPPAPQPRAEADTWSDLAPQPAGDPRPPASAEEQVRAAAARAQQQGLKASRDFFSKNFCSDDEEDEDDEDEGKDGLLGFFIELFEKDSELRRYYEKNGEKGEFSCLVCEVIGVKKWKRFGNCVALVQHANSISKTKRKGAHRAFATAVCRVLGWDISRLPSVVLDMGETLGQSSSKAAKSQDDMQKEGISEQQHDPVDNKEDNPKDATEGTGQEANSASVEITGMENSPNDNCTEGKLAG